MTLVTGSRLGPYHIVAKRGEGAPPPLDQSSKRASARSTDRGKDLAVIGQTLGPYQVLSKLGEGGMGEVYRARDTKLDRDVAIKILPASVAGDPDRLARFEREAKALAALNHPHIAHVHGVEESGGGPALVMELVEGDGLDEKIRTAASSRKPRAGLPLDEALPIARQIADALEAAHRQGIAHRDLKPANIKVRRRWHGLLRVEIRRQRSEEQQHEDSATETQGHPP